MASYLVGTLGNHRRIYAGPEHPLYQGFCRTLSKASLRRKLWLITVFASAGLVLGAAFHFHHAPFPL